MTTTPTVRVDPATAPLLTALVEDPAAFARAIGSRIPDGWPDPA